MFRDLSIFATFVKDLERRIGVAHLTVATFFMQGIMAQLPQTQTDLDVWRGLLRVHARMTSNMSAHLQSETGLTLAEYELLLHLYEHPAERMPMSELARLVLLTPSGITRMVDRLVGRGLVERQSVRSDARVQHAVLTETGRDTFTKAGRVHLADVRSQFLSVLSAEQRADLSLIWNKLLESSS
jgi:DNA-binding MarR family transcriptional regulator